MKIDSAFPSKFLKASDLVGEVNVVMSTVQIQEVGTNKEERPVLYFQGSEKGLVLNKTNAGVITEAYGGETDAWAGRTLIIYPTTTDYAGKVVDCLRVKIPTLPSVAPQNLQEVTDKHGTPPDTSDIPF